MFLNDAVLEPYGAAVFGMSICATTALNASLAVGLLLGVCGAFYAYSRGFATIPGGGLLTLFKTFNGDDVFAAYGGVFGLRILGFLVAAVLMRRLDVTGFRRSVQYIFCDFMKNYLD